MSEMTALEYLKERNRMTKKCSISCSECGISYENNGEKYTCDVFECDFPEKAISIVQKWAEEHPKKTILQDFLEKYPNVEIDEDGLPNLCPSFLGFKEFNKCGCKKACKDCWNSPLEE